MTAARTGTTRTPEDARQVPVLVVGGTGMLAGAVRELVRRGHPTAVLARDATRLHDLAESATGPGEVVPVQTNYAAVDDTRAKLAGAVGELGRFGAVVLWVHTPFRARVHTLVGDACLAEEALVVDVLGSAGRPPREIQPEVPEPFRRPGVTYRQAVLGFTDGPAGTRWLTDTEISKGAIAAFDGPGESTVVGRLHPWRDRPGG